MPSPRNVSVSAERTINMALDLLDRQKQRLCAIVESERATPDEKYQALVSLAYMTGILMCEAAAGEVEKRSRCDGGSPQVLSRLIRTRSRTEPVHR